MAESASGKVSCIRASLLAWSVVSVLWAGCATSRYLGPVHGLTMEATIEAIDLKSRHLRLVPAKPSELLVFGWDGATKFWKNGVPIPAEEVEPGKPVRVHYHVTSSGESIAHHIYIQDPYAPQH